MHLLPIIIIISNCLSVLSKYLAIKELCKYNLEEISLVLFSYSIWTYSILSLNPYIPHFLWSCWERLWGSPSPPFSPPKEKRKKEKNWSWKWANQYWFWGAAGEWHEENGIWMLKIKHFLFKIRELLQQLIFDSGKVLTALEIFI